ncbi:Rha family transcriptional regulator [Dysgonomonas mossii]|uniref:Rha family transcriptional regulator n=1 Tax=Dysgonomonas mossii TaxID=163665 RepID=UPI0034C65F5B
MSIYEENTLNYLLLNSFNQNGAALTNSLLVAGKFGKEHNLVMRTVRDLLTSVQNCTHLFIESEYPDSYNRMQPMYIMNRDGFTLLAMGFTGKVVLRRFMAFLCFYLQDIHFWD